MGFYILLLTYPESKQKKMGIFMRKFLFSGGWLGGRREKKYGKNKEVINGEYNDYLKIKLLVCCGNKKQTLPIVKCCQMENSMKKSTQKPIKLMQH